MADPGESLETLGSGDGLLERLRAGDEAAYEILVRLHGHSVCRRRPASLALPWWAPPTRRCSRQVNL